MPALPPSASLDSRPTTRRWTPAWIVSAPAGRRGRAVIIILLVILAIGWVDLLTGFWVSLQLFYLIPILMAVAWLGWRGALVTSVVCVIVRLAGDVAAGMFLQVDALAVFWNRLAEVGVSWILVWVFHALISLQRDLERRVQQRTASLEQAVTARDEMQRQLFEVSERERSTIGHDLHDGLGQHLTATSIAANVLATRLAANAHPDADRARKVVDLVQEGIAQTRQIARGLLLSAVEPADLASELEELVTSLQREHGIACSFEVRGKVERINVATASQLFYIAQEAGRNSARHAKATRISIALAIDARELSLEVVDDGVGLPVLAPDRPGMGLRIMRHRSELIGAVISITAMPDRGTRVRCRMTLPIPEMAAAS